MHFIAQRVHRLPEAGIAISSQLGNACERVERRGLPRGVVAFNPVDNRRIEHKEAAVDKRVVTRWLFDERLHYRVFEFERTVTSWRQDRRDRRQLAMAEMEALISMSEPSP
jgi:hypothetical protein